MPKINRYTSIFFVIAFLFFVLKASSIYPKISDENIWFYAAYLLEKGVLPYRDFFQSSLPGHLLLLYPIIKIFGFNLYILKLVPILASIGSGFLLFKIVSTRHSVLDTESIAHRSRIESGMTAGLISATFFLFSFTVLVTTDHDTGVHETTFFMLLTWYLLCRKKIATAGIIFFFGLLVRVYLVPAIFALTLWYLFKRKFREVIKFSIVGVLLFLASNFLLFKYFGNDFLDQAWKYHLLKTTGIDKGKIFTYFLTNEWLLILLVVVAVLAVLIKLFQNKEVIIPPLIAQSFLMLGAQIGFYLLFADIYYLYLVMIIPFIAIIAGYGVEVILKDVNFDKTKVIWGLVGVVIIFNVANYITNHAQTSRITELAKITRDVKALTGEGDTIFGTFGVVPLVAAQSGLNITKNQVDTNAKRNMTGLLSSDKATEYALESNIFIQLAFIQDDGQGNKKIISLDPDYVSQRKIQDNCTLFRTYKIEKDYSSNAILLWECKGN